MTPDLLKKLSVVGHDLDTFSRETVAMFRTDALAAGYDIPLSAPGKTRRFAAVAG